MNLSFRLIQGSDSDLLVTSAILECEGSRSVRYVVYNVFATNTVAVKEKFN